MTALSIPTRYLALTGCSKIPAQLFIYFFSKGISIPVYCRRGCNWVAGWTSYADGLNGCKATFIVIEDPFLRYLAILFLIAK
jgi:hypothetical protein